MAKESSKAVLDIVQYFEGIGGPQNSVFGKWNLYRPRIGCSGGDIPCRIVFSIKTGQRLNIQDLYNIDESLRKKIRGVFVSSVGDLVVETEMFTLGSSREKSLTPSPNNPKRMRSE